MEQRTLQRISQMKARHDYPKAMAVLEQDDPLPSGSRLEVDEDGTLFVQDNICLGRARWTGSEWEEV